jgi:hypothetical protein
MSDLKIAVPGLDYFTEQSTTQFVIPLGAGATFAASNNIATITTNAAHGLTFTPAANVLPNYFIQFATAATVTTGTGVLLNQIFRILSIPSSTTFTIYTTVTAATITGTTFNPVFMPVFQTNLISNVSTNPPGLNLPYPGSSQLVNFTFGANCVAQYNPDNTYFPLDQSVNGGVTPSVAPTFRTMGAASSGGQLRFGPQDIIIANGTTATSRISICQ